jgi:acetylornithine/N-succinyldiaminopimelate aminotransferase
MNYDLIDKDKELFLQVYNRIPVNISHGKGVFLFDKNGDKYLDFFSGLGVNALGYSHPRIVDAVSSQISRFAHLSNNFLTDIQIEFTSLLLQYSGMSKAFLTNSGTEAIEGAIKLIRKHKGPDAKIFSLSNSFHGRTYGAVTLTAKDKYQKGFEPLLPNIDYIKFNDLHDLQSKVNDTTAAIFLEFIQGEGGINIVSDQFASLLSELKSKYNFVLVADAIQCGIGRTGKPFSFNYYNIQPDIICTAKAIGGGLPLGAFLTAPYLDNIFELGKHGTTFGGNPLSCAAGKVVLEEVFQNGLMQQVYNNGSHFIEQLEHLKRLFPDLIKEVRGRGYMIGVEFFYPCKNIVRNLLEKKVLSNCTNENVLRILPPLIADESHIEIFIQTLKEVLGTVKNEL